MVKGDAHRTHIQVDVRDAFVSMPIGEEVYTPFPSNLCAEEMQMKCVGSVGSVGVGGVGSVGVGVAANAADADLCAEEMQTTLPGDLYDGSAVFVHHGFEDHNPATCSRAPRDSSSRLIAPNGGAVQPSGNAAQLTSSRERREQQTPAPVASDNKAEVDVSKAMDLTQASGASPSQHSPPFVIPSIPLPADDDFTLRDRRPRGTGGPVKRNRNLRPSSEALGRALRPGPSGAVCVSEAHPSSLIPPADDEVSQDVASAPVGIVTRSPAGKVDRITPEGALGEAPLSGPSGTALRSEAHSSSLALPSNSDPRLESETVVLALTTAGDTIAQTPLASQPDQLQQLFPNSQAIALCDNGATINCSRDRLGAIAGTFDKTAAGLVSVGDTASKLLSHGTDLCALELVGLDGCSVDVLRKVHYTPKALVEVIIAETVEVLHHKSTIVFSPAGRTISFADNNELTMALSPNGLGWLGVRSITDPQRIQCLLNLNSTGAPAPSIKKTQASTDLLGLARWSKFGLLRMMHMIFNRTMCFVGLICANSFQFIHKGFVRWLWHPVSYATLAAPHGPGLLMAAAAMTVLQSVLHAQQQRHVAQEAVTVKQNIKMTEADTTDHEGCEAPQIMVDMAS